MSSISKSIVLNSLPVLTNCSETKKQVFDNIRSSNKKLIVLDDDPTGVQTVNNVPVYTVWEEDDIKLIFKEKSSLVYILTNSRGLNTKEAEDVNRLIAQRVCKVSKEAGIQFNIIHRGDSTLRGHYPLETQVVKETIERNTGLRFDGEIIVPFFKEGGRLTYNDIHWVEDEGWLMPAGKTEFAKDNTFGYTNSDLKLWVEEKTLGEFKHEDVISISLDMIRLKGYMEVAQTLMKAKNFQKIIVNAFDYDDLYIFAKGLLKAEELGSKFLYRSAASFVKVMGTVEDRSPLTKKDLVKENGSGGLVIIGSHVAKTTRQLNHALEIDSLKTVEMKVEKVIAGEYSSEVSRVLSAVESEISQGYTVILYTTREVVKAKGENSEDNLTISVRISKALVDVVRALKIVPKFIIAKGGITSSDIGTKGLGVRRAVVAGQIKPGIPVWITDSASKFSELPYIIFPGNVGNDYTLKEIISELQS